MSPKNIAQITFAVLLIGLLWLGIGSRAGAQRQPPNQTISFNQTDVRAALQQVFKGVNVSYSLAPNVQGVVTLELKQVTFETLLENILRQVDATYRIEGGVYEIIKKQVSDPAPADPIGQGGQASYINAPTDPGSITQDDRYLYILRGPRLYKVNKGDLKVVATGSLGR